MWNVATLIIASRSRGLGLFKEMDMNASLRQTIKKVFPIPYVPWMIIFNRVVEVGMNNVKSHALGGRQGVKATRI